MTEVSGEKRAIGHLAPAIRRREKRRGPGRPPKRSATTSPTDLSAESITETAVELCREIDLVDLSVVRLARRLNVTPAAIYYYIDDRDTLLANIISRFWQMLLPCFDHSEDLSWKSRVSSVARALYEKQVTYKGINSYLIFNNRFSLIQSDTLDGKCGGLQYLEELLSLFRSEGFSVTASLANSRVLTQFIADSANATSRRRLPSQYKQFLGAALKRIDKESFPCVREAMAEFTAFGPDSAFDTGLQVLIRGFLDPPQPSSE